MKFKKKLVLSSVLLLLLAGCIHIAIQARYEFNLIDMQRSKRVIDKYGAGSIDKENLIFEDKLIKVVFSPQENGIGISILNNSDNSIRMLWDESSYIDFDGSSHRVIHLGTRFIRADQPQPVMTIAAGARLDDLMVPADYAQWETTTSLVWKTDTSGWNIRPLFPKTARFAYEKEFENVISNLDGKTFRVLLSLKVGDNINDYLSTFIIKAWIER